MKKKYIHEFVIISVLVPIFVAVFLSRGRIAELFHEDKKAVIITVVASALLFISILFLFKKMQHLEIRYDEHKYKNKYLKKIEKVLKFGQSTKQIKDKWENQE